MPRPLAFASFVIAMGAPAAAFAQGYTGELRLAVVDPHGAPIHATLSVINEGEHVDREVSTDDAGTADLKPLPFGLYRVTARSGDLLVFSEVLEVRSALPQTRTLRLSIAPQNTLVQVNADATLVDPARTSSSVEIGPRQIADRLSSLPGRSVQDLIVSQPGWLYEGNAVLHPRGSEYQTQFLVDGLPLTDNRSPSFGPEIEADDLESISIFTAGFPAEYGRKLGGVVDLNTHKNTSPGLHGQLDLAGGSYAAAYGFGQLQLLSKKNTFSLAASGGTTDHYLNPVVPQNDTNTGTTADFSGRYERDLTPRDTLTLGLRHELARFLIPNELLQQQAGQVQNGDNFETLGTAGYQHTVSANTLLTFAGMVRDKANDLLSNTNPTPIAATQHNSFREGYLKADVSLHAGPNEFKAGLESDNTFLHENFAYTLTDPTQFNSDTPPALAFAAARPDLEQAAYVQDLLRLGGWTLNAGLRWDHYQLLLNQNAFSPRLSVARFVRPLHLVLHGSYDRIFQTPSSDNILISSSPAIQALSTQFLRLPVQPSRGDYFEGGLTEGFFDRLRLDANFYRRQVRNYADDDQLLNTGVSYPIAFDHAVIYGAEAKLELLKLGRFSGFASYSYMVGSASFPVTGGLFLGDDAASAVVQQSGHFPDSQDQRNTLNARGRYDLNARLWFAAGLSFGSGLPFEYTGTEDDALSTYGPAVVDRLNFARGRILPTLAANASAGANLYSTDRLRVSLQADGENLNNRLNILDFGGLFSGNAIEVGRSFNIRLKARL